MKAIIYKSTGSWYEAKTEEGHFIQARTVGKLRLDDLKSTNPIAVGDEVKLQKEENGEHSIVEILPRSNYVLRQSPRKKHNVHLLAANIHQAMLIVTMREPDLKTGFIDRFLMMTEPYNIPVIIVFNKSDIYEEEDKERLSYFTAVYQNLGYKVITSSIHFEASIDQLKALIKDKITLVAGQSGVGKSSIVNTLQPGIGLKTDEISDYSGKGQHTTTFAEMFDLDIGGAIIDTPGIKTLAFNHYEIKDIAHNFRDIFAESESCKFANCTHRNEPKCNVKYAVEQGWISEHRYQNYLQLLVEVEDQNYWERHTDL